MFCWKITENSSLGMVSIPCQETESRTTLDLVLSHVNSQTHPSPRRHDGVRPAHPKCMGSQYMGGVFTGTNRRQAEHPTHLSLLRTCRHMTYCSDHGSPPWWTVPQTMNQNKFFLSQFSFWIFFHRNEVSNAPATSGNLSLSLWVVYLPVCVCMCLCAHEGQRLTQGTFPSHFSTSILWDKVYHWREFGQTGLPESP